MSATQEKQKPPTTSKYVDFDEFIEFHLRKTRSGIHQADLLTSSLVLISFIAGYLLLFTLADQWLVPGGIPQAIRLTLLLLAVSIASIWAVLKIAFPWVQRVNTLYAAREIERAHPELKSSLLTWVNLQQSGRRVPADVLSVLEKRTAHQVERVDVNEAVDRRPLMHATYVLMAIVVAICIYAVASPKKMSTSVWRALFPVSPVSVATRTQILKVTPGDFEVLARDQAEIDVEIGGRLPEEVTLLFTTADRRFIDEPLKMRNIGEGTPVYRTRLVGEGGAGLQKDVTYFIRAGDATSQRFHIRVNQPPSAAVADVTYDYPRYMALDRAVQPGGSIDAWEGTTVTVRATANMPVKRAMLYCSDHEMARESAEAYEMAVQGDSLTARWQLKFRNDGTFAKHYHVQLWNERDQTDPQPAVQRIKIRPDLKPEVELIHPEADLEAPANATVPISFAARDPDFLLRRIVLKLERNGDPLPLPQPLFEGPPDVAQFQSTHHLNLEKFGLFDGEELSFYLEAEDNFEPFGNRGKNISRSPKRTIQIVASKPPQEVDNFNREQEQQAQEKLEEQTAKDESRPGDENQEPTPAGESNAPPEEEATSPAEQPPGNDPNGNQQPQNGDRSGEQDPNEQGAPGARGENQEDRKQPGSQNTDETGDNRTNGTGQPREDGQPGEGQQAPGEKSSSNQNQGTPSGDSSQKDPARNGNTTPPGSTPKQDGRPDASKGTGPREEKAADDQALKELLKWNEEQQQKEQSSPGDTDGQRPGETSPEGQQSEPQTSPGDSLPEDRQEPSSGDAPANDDQSSEQSPADERSPMTPGEATDPSTRQQDSPNETSPGTGNDGTLPPEANPSAERRNNPEETGDPGDRPPTESQSPDQQGSQETQRSDGDSAQSDNRGDADQRSGTGESQQQTMGETREASPSEQSPSQGQGEGQETRESDPQKGGADQNNPDQGQAGDKPTGQNDQREPSNGEQGERPQTNATEQSARDQNPQERNPQNPQRSPENRNANGSQPNNDPASPSGSPQTPPGNSGDGASPQERPQDASQDRSSDPSSPQPGQQPPGQQSSPQQGESGQRPSQDGSSQPGQSQQGQPQQGQQSESGSDSQSSGEQSPGQQSSGEPSAGEQGGGQQSKEPSQGQDQNQSGDGPQGGSQQGNAPSGSGQEDGQRQGDGQQNDGQQGDSRQQEGNQQDSPSQPHPGGAGQNSPPMGGSPGGDKPGSEQSGSTLQSEQPNPNQSGGNQASGPSGAPSTGAASSPDGADGNPGQGRSAPDTGAITPEQADLENRKKATDLALRRLREQLERGDTPQDLMNRLGYTEQDLDRFMQKLQENLADQSGQRTPEMEASQRQFESLLKGIDYQSTGQVRDGGTHQREASEGFGAGNRPVPPRYRQPNQGFKSKQSKQGTAPMSRP